ncbi:MAG: hypothetical protein ACRESU_04120, partial [Gammaproteobacteria bacterium]
TLQTASPAAEVNRVTLDVGVGQLKVTASSDDKIHVQVQLEQKSQNFLWFFHWMSNSTVKEIEQVTLQQQNQDGIAYSLKYPEHLDEGDIKQDWEVQVPAALAIKIEMGVGQLDLTGVAGGVDASLNVGEVTLNTPRGPLQVKVNVGQINATSASTQPGNIKLSTSIGDARVYMPGGSDHDDVHHNGLGRTIEVAGKGPDKMDLEVNIGEVTLHIEPAKSDDKK